jgi:hypothetical protein
VYTAVGQRPTGRVLVFSHKAPVIRAIEQQ